MTSFLTLRRLIGEPEDISKRLKISSFKLYFLNNVYRRFRLNFLIKRLGVYTWILLNLLKEISYVYTCSLRRGLSNAYGESYPETNDMA